MRRPVKTGRSNSASQAASGVLCVVLFLTFSPIPSQAGEYNLKAQSPSESKIALDSDQPWLAPNEGSYEGGWEENYSSHMSIATWKESFSELNVVVYSLPGLMRWGDTGHQIKKHDLRAQFGESMTLFDKIKCQYNSCARFDISEWKCFIVNYFTAPPGSSTQSDKGVDLVYVTHCSVDLKMPDVMNGLISAINIRKQN